MTKKYTPKKDKTGFITVKNKPSVEDLERHYNDLYFSDEKHRPTNYQENYDNDELEHINLMNDLCLYSLEKIRPEWRKKPGSMLEVGAGEGFMLSRSMSKGWDVLGIDYNSFGIEKFNPHVLKKSKFGNAFEMLIDLGKNKTKFDVCVMQNVLEHVINPRELLTNIKKLIKNRGIIVIRIPNDYSKTQLLALKMGYIKEKFWYAPPEHLNYFNAENIGKFMKEMKLKILDMYSSFPIDFFIFHSGSNYVKQKKNGKEVHKARVHLDLLMAQNGIENYHKLCQSLSSCGVGRNITLILEKSG